MVIIHNYYYIHGHHLLSIGKQKCFIFKDSRNIFFQKKTKIEFHKFQFTIQSDCQYRVTKAVIDDADILLNFVNEMEKYYHDAPIFLKRDSFSRDEILNIIQNEHAFLAWDGDYLIGVMSFSTNQGFHYERLTSNQSGYIKGIGGYIKSEYRGQGIGSRLLQEMFNYCYEAGKPFIHVSFESANPFANKFWPKYFKPVIRSIRRTINKDANS